MSESVRRLKANKVVAGKKCGWCREPLSFGEDAAICGECRALHHGTCWDEKGGCARHGCVNAPLQRVEPALAPPPLVGPGIPAVGHRTCPHCGARLRGRSVVCGQCGLAPTPDGIYRGPKVNAPGAVASFVCGLVGIFFCGIILGIIAIVNANCSHVAMPYLSPSAWRDASRAQPVWVYLSDGRNARGRVAWVGPPPLDVAVVTVDLPDPPAPIPVQESAEAVDAGAPVFFVPNPLRSGWRVHRGRVQRREPHETPAGRFSLVFSDLPVLPDDSGSGLFLEDGRLVGLNTWRRESPGVPVAIGLPSDALREILSILEAEDPGRLLERGEGR